MSLINRHNYEEFFILYMDNELGATDKRMVEEFVNLHPDLKEELDMLLQSKLEPDHSITFGNKEDLIFTDNSTINFSNYEEWLVLYIDNELEPARRLEVEQFIAAHPELQKELDLYSKTQLTPETIIFPDKKSLYRREEKTRPVYWWRVAAAAALLAGALTTYILLNDGKEQVDTSLANNSGSVEMKNSLQTENAAETKQADNNSVDAIASTVQSNEIKTPNVATKLQGKEEVKQATEVIRKQEETIASTVVANNTKGNNLPLPDQNPNVDAYAELKGNTALQQNAPDKNDLTTSPVNTITAPVTNSASYASLQSKNSDALDNADDFETDGKKNKLRGFFRKVTRNFEKRTNINATDDDDRLLVGGLAIRLK